MKTLLVIAIALLLVGCDHQPRVPEACTPTGESSKLIEIDSVLMTRPKSFNKPDYVLVNETRFLIEYGDLAKAYTSCYRTLNGLISVLENSGMIRSVPSVTNFKPDLNPKEQE